ncbi:helix-turn-helix domain-containing protein [Chryseobacterium sediminis]|uniref:Helix-turn-helix domain-containing protein n=1 Tax=Chryseobacterium sediminis TaxID=1679494 RepID=A0A5B2UB98_9FLAO|nr:helix-turn-helix domain-containing protein [Chryseobacterium sediminis]KAA2223627.1 helix-turn-helix domain-containing protein [Chryseobacterium sediminis]
MDKQIQIINAGPNYKQIYHDFIEAKCPDKREYVKGFLSKNSLSVSDVLKINTIIFDELSESQKFKSYDKQTIFEILDYQKKHRLNNTQLASHFKLSRNTVTKWKRTFLI